MILPYVLSLSKLGLFRLDDLLESDEKVLGHLSDEDEIVLAVHDYALVVELDREHEGWADVYANFAPRYVEETGQAAPTLGAFLNCVTLNLLDLEVTHT